MTRALLIDTDPGIDDALAIALALAVPEVDVIGITTVGGNTGLEKTTRNALALLELLGRNDIPVASGYDQPYKKPKILDSAESVHGKDGFGNTDLPLPTTKLASTDSSDFLAKKINESKNPVTLVAIGPLTNIAHLIDKHPDVVEKLDRLVIMGGAAKTGNVTPVAEFNIWHDPDAAKRVFTSGLKVVMVGLDATHSVKTYESLWTWLDSTKKFDSVFAKMLTHYTDFYASVYGERMTHQHDALAMAEAIWPGTMELQDAFIDVECESELTFGMTVVDTRMRQGQKPNSQVAWGLNGELFHDRLIKAMKALSNTIK